MELLQKGDVVCVLGTLRFDQQTDGRLHLVVNHYDVVVPPEDATLHLRHFTAGDKAFLPSKHAESHDFTVVEVIATHDCLVWVKDENGGTEVADAMDLLREMPAQKARS